MTNELKKLARALACGSYPTSELTNGSRLEFEDLAIPKGLYKSSEIDLNDPDIRRFGNHTWDGEALYYKISEGYVNVFKE